MRLITAALLGAAAVLPTPVHATTSLPDPADATAAVPDMTVPSAFDGYRPYGDATPKRWPQLNRVVQDELAIHGKKHGGMKHAGMKHGSEPDEPAGDQPAGHAMHGEAAR
ncbi:hypothetical protein DIE19_28775 [Burkholderia sp. Bp9126]|nr:hypothetical protein DIE19_28775 [Burkholderia sp. Bp9126]